MGGGSGSSSGTKSTNVAAAGPARNLGTYPQYNPISYQGMQPGAINPAPGMGAPQQSYMPAIQGLPGFGGVPANQLIQSLMQGYAGVPMAQQATGAQAPGMGMMSQPAGSLPGPTGTDVWGGLTNKQRKQLKKIGVNSGTFDPSQIYGDIFQPPAPVTEATG